MSNTTKTPKTPKTAAQQLAAPLSYRAIMTLRDEAATHGEVTACATALHGAELEHAAGSHFVCGPQRERCAIEINARLQRRQPYIGDESSAFACRADPVDGRQKGDQLLR